MAYSSAVLPLADNTELLLRGALFTLELTAIGAVLGISIGLVGALVQARNIRPFADLFRLYVELIRNTPFLMQLLCIFFGLPAIGVPVSAWQAAALAMVINLGAHATLIIRDQLQVIPVPRLEAMRPVLNSAWPALSNQIIVVMLGSSVCSMIATQELSFVANVLQSRNLHVFETYALTTLMYLCMALMIRQFLNRAGQWLFAEASTRRCASAPARD
ncbi:amino acid ABC transporter permease [Pseudomonas sp. MYb118]|uniref:amino acid ABC transporter permease n=1 Tax=Pseudomonas sp. MYb118 TaxID=1848720 RepID=UPI0034CE0F4F